MKTEISKPIFNMVVIALLALGSAKAQDTDTIKKSENIKVKETERTRETTVTRDTVVKMTEPVQVIDPTENKPELHRWEVGLRLLPSFSSMEFRSSNGDVIQGEATMSNGYGLMLGLNITKMVGILAEVDYLEISQKYKDINLDREVHINYLSIPVLLSLNTDKSRMVNVNFVIGPQFGINTGSTTKTNGSAESDTLHAVVAIRQGDVGVAYGAGLEIMLTRSRTLRLDFGFRGYYGLIDMNSTTTSENPATYNIIIQASRKTYGGYAGLTFLF